MFNIPTVDLVATGKNIEKLRKEVGLSVKELQNIFGFGTPQAIYKWESGKNLPTIDNCIILARLLGVNMEELLVINEW